MIAYHALRCEHCSQLLRAPRMSALNADYRRHLAAAHPNLLAPEARAEWAAATEQREDGAE